MTATSSMPTPGPDHSAVPAIRPPAQPLLAGLPGILSHVAQAVAATKEQPAAANGSCSLVLGVQPSDTTPQSCRSSMPDVLHPMESLPELPHPLPWMRSASTTDAAEHIRQINALEQPDDQAGKHDVVLGNPPFSTPLGSTDLAAHLAPWRTAKSEGMFIVEAITQLRQGGQIAMLVPDSVLFKSSKVYSRLREWLVTAHTLAAVISLPIGIFQPYAGVKTSVLIVTKGGATSDIQFYQVPDSAQPTVSRSSIKPGAAIDLQSCVHWVTSASQLEDGFRLDAQIYAPVPEDTTVYEDPRTIIVELIAMQHEVIQHLEALQRMLEEPPVWMQAEHPDAVSGSGSASE